MNKLTNFYPIKSIDAIEKYLAPYLQLVILNAEQYQLNLNVANISGDHLGLQVLSSEEFDECHEILLHNAEMINDGVIYNRRNRIYQFKTIPQAHGIDIPRIEIFEPKPNVDVSKLRPGIEHVAFTVKDYDNFLSVLCA